MHIKAIYIYKNSYTADIVINNKLINLSLLSNVKMFKFKMK